jgi:hypothetical protein
MWPPRVKEEVEGERMRVGRKRSLIPVEKVEETILFIRGQNVILDADLARLYGTTTKRLNEQVKRNRERFPEDFMFQLTTEEKAEVVAICDHLSSLKYSPALPHAFTEHGALMAANILKSKTAVSMSIYVVRAFIRMREELTSRRDLEERLSQIEKILLLHDTQLKELFEKIRPLLLNPPEKPKRRIGFEVKEPRAQYGKKR